MISHRFSPGPCLILLGLAVALCVLPSAKAQEQQEEVKGTPAEPADAEETRQQIAAVQKLLPGFPDRGAVLYFIAVADEHLRETRAALDKLKECLALQEGFDPSTESAFMELRQMKEFTSLIDGVHKDFPVVAQARGAFRTTEKDLVPEGLAYDEHRGVFYMSSLNRRKIIQIDRDGVASDFVPDDRYHLLPILGIRVAPDQTIWSDSFSDAGRTELLHFDATGKLLGRFSPNTPGKHGFNDLVVRKNGEVFITDSLANAVLRFDSAAASFSNVPVHRPLFYPNGIALAADDHTLYVADSLGVVQVDLASGASHDVDPGPRNTLAGIDGLYWRNDTLVAIQNGIGSPRIAVFRLSRDGLRVTRATVLENRSSFTVLPTTGALRGPDFLFIANSQIDNLNNDKVMDVTRLEVIRVGVLRLP